MCITIGFHKLKILIFLSFVLNHCKASDCLKKEYGDSSFVCVCNEDYCDEFQPIEKALSNQYVTYTTNIQNLRFKKYIGTYEESGKNRNKIVIGNEKLQTILGWGGAFSDSSCINIMSLSRNVKDKLLKSYFSNNGLQYNLCRVPVAGTDFSTRSYSYNDGPIDVNLTNFKLQFEDEIYKIPLIKEAQEVSENKLKLFASAWSSPNWMKVNNKSSGFLAYLRKDMYQVWADYILKFLQAYDDFGINFWGLTTGNEPLLGFIPDIVIKTPSIAWLPWDMKKWIIKNLGPTIRESKYSDIKIMALDDQRFFLPWYIDLIFNNKIARDYIDGIAVHWYFDYYLSGDLLNHTHEKYPEKFLLSTEAARERFPTELNHVSLGSWANAEEYANNIIEDMNYWVTGWIDWNIALDCQGGPTYTNNYLNAPIIVNATNNEFYKQPAYYILGHFSRFVPEGSVKLSLKQFDHKVPATAFIRPDGGKVVVILNRKKYRVLMEIRDDSKNVTIPLALTKKSITTILYW